MHTSPNHLKYDGQSGAVFKIWFVNFLLCVVTLWIYRPWAKTRMRRYVYSRFSFMGKYFQYNGTGGELFRGGLAVYGSLILSLVILGGIVNVLYIMGEIDRENPDMRGIIINLVYNLIYYAALLSLFYLGKYAGMRYRFSRTRWQGIRGAIVGKASRYVKAGLGYFLLNLVTLGFIKYKNDVKLRSILANNMYFGQQKVNFTADASSLKTVHLVTWLLAIPTLGFSRYWYRAALNNLFLANMEAGSLRFHGTQTGGRLLGLVLGNILLMFTLIGIPFALQRFAVFYATHTHITGEVSEEALKQIISQGSGMGDVLGDAYDGGVDFDMGLL